MKALVCELCGGNELLKQDGIFICTHCGTKYTPEEAKKLIIEGTVDVSGSTIKVDNSSFVEKYLQNARRAKQKEDWEETEKYYNLVEQNDPTNLEAIFYSAYGKAKASLIDNDLYKRQAAFNVLQNCISILDDNFDIEKEKEQKDVIKQISSDILAMACSNYVYNQKKNGYGIVVKEDKMETITMFNSLGNEFIKTLNNIAKKFPESQKEKRVFYYKLALKHAEWILENGSLVSPIITQDKIMTYHKKINKIDPSHVVPEKAPEPGGRDGACYVATAVYGSYDCPQVWTLRRYRDDTLAGTWYGRAFIHTYYAISPTLVKWFGHTDWFRNMWKPKLDKMVDRLQKQGVADTPYNDKNWQ